MSDTEGLGMGECGGHVPRPSAEDTHAANLARERADAARESRLVDAAQIVANSFNSMLVLTTAGREFAKRLDELRAALAAYNDEVNEERARKWLTDEGCFCPIAIPADEDTVTSLAALLDEVRAEVLREVIASEAPPLRPLKKEAP